MRTGLILIIVILIATFSAAQCELPKSQFEQARNIFTPEQENYLGDIVAQEAQHHFRPIADTELNDYPNRVAQRLLKRVPASPHQYRVILVDEPYANAFSIIGARIYVTRKAALLARNEDELAGLLAHEISHIYTNQMGADFTNMFQQVLGVSQVTDRADITRKYHQVLNTWRTRRVKYDRKHSDQEQFVADQTAIFMMALAGYRPAAFGEYFDRFAETQGKTGGFWSDFFGTTAPESKRLRAIFANVSSLPPSCIAQNKAPASDFTGWQSHLLEWSGTVVADQLHNVVLQKKLLPPLLADVHWVRFSRDGKYILAQDDSTVSVLTRQPFSFLFRVDLPQRAFPSTFAPDSSHLIVGSNTGRVEKYDLISMKRDSVHELPLLQQCLQSSFSPDGNSMACFTADGTLRVLELATGEKKFEKKQFSSLNTFAAYLAIVLRQLGVNTPLISMDFTSDGNVFAAGSSENLVVLDAKTYLPLEVHGNLKGRMKVGFVFAGTDRIVTRDFGHPTDAFLQEFPSGNPIRTMKTGDGEITPVTKGDFALVNSGQDVSGILDTKEGKFVGSLKSTAPFDMYDKDFISERRNGWLELGEYTDRFSSNGRSVELPTPQLGHIEVAELSGDLSWLAISQGSRGGFFKLQDGTRQSLVRGFKGGWFDDKQLFWGDFPKVEKTERTIVTVNPGQNSFVSNRELKKEGPAQQEGPYLVVSKPEKPGSWSDNWTVEVRDVRDDKLLWSRALKGNPHKWFNWTLDTVVIAWNANSPQMKEAAKTDATLSARLAQLGNRDSSYVLEIVQLATGSVLGRLVVDTGKGSFGLGQAQASRDFVVVADTNTRVHIYSLKSGEEQNVMFAENFDLSKTGMLAVKIDNHRLQVFDLNSSEKIDEASFASPVAFAGFLGDGSRLLVLTRNQMAFVLKPQADAVDVTQASAQ